MDLNWSGNPPHTLRPQLYILGPLPSLLFLLEYMPSFRASFHNPPHPSLRVSYCFAADMSQLGAIIVDIIIHRFDILIVTFRSQSIQKFISSGTDWNKHDENEEK